MGVAPDRKVEDGMSYLLSPFRKAQLKVVDEMLDVAAEAVKVILKEGAAAAMNRFNRKVETRKRLATDVVNVDLKIVADGEWNESHL